VRYRIYGYHAKQPAPTCLPTEMDSSPQDELTVVDESDFAILSLDSGFQKSTNSKLCRFLEPVYWLTPAYILQRFFRGRLLTVMRERTKCIKRRLTSSCISSTSLPEAFLSSRNKFAVATSTQKSTIRSNCFSISYWSSSISRFSSSRLEVSCSPAATITSSEPILGPL
jgi:hypothetical protein